MSMPPGGPRPVSLGVLGCADIAVRRVLPAVVAAANAELAAVASRSLSRARTVTSTFGGEPVEGYARLLERDDVDAVYVPLPAALHAEWTERALRAGKHVLAEKPLTTAYRDTDRLLTLATERGSVLTENFLFLHHPQYEIVRSLLAEGAVGAPLHLSASFTVPPRPEDDIRLRAELGGGALLDMGVYPLRLALLLLGPDLDLVGAALRRDRKRGVDVGGAVLLRRPHDGVTVQLTFGMEHRYTACWDLLGSTGRLELAHGAYSPPADHVPVLRLDGGDGPRELRLDPHDQVRTAVTRFADAVRAGRPTTDGETARAQARLVDEIRRFARVTEI
jgi:predicted dehydrogenase